MRIGIFEVLADDGEKYMARKLVVRCTVCGTVAERKYASVTTYTGEGCIHCVRRKLRDAIVKLLRERPRTRMEIAYALGQHKNSTIRILRAMLDDGEIISYRSERRQQPWIYEAT